MSKKTLKNVVHNSDMESRVMQKITSGQVIMRPRWYFIVGSLAMSLGLVGASIGALFLTNLSFFLMRQHGPRGEWRLQLMLESFPWWVPIMAILSIGLGIYLLKKYDFSYKQNFAGIAGLFVVAIIIAGLIIDVTNLSQVWFGHGPMRKLYQKADDVAQTADSLVDAYGPMGYGRGRGNGMLQAGSSAKGQSLSAVDITKDTCLMDGCLAVADAEYPVATLDEQTVGFLHAALADERKALATYQATMAKFGTIKPFVNIARAEEQHIAMLLGLFDKYGVAIPADTTVVGELPETVSAVCQIGAIAEIENDALYQNMVPKIHQSDIRTVFTSLAVASKEMHLPAFERCSN